MPEKEKLPAEFTEVMRKAASAEEMARLSEVFEVGKIFMFRRFHGWIEKQTLLKSAELDGLLPEEVCGALLKAMDEVGPDPCSLKSFVEGIREDAGDDVRKFCEWRRRMVGPGMMTENEFEIFVEAAARGKVKLADYVRAFKKGKDSQAEACATQNEGGQVK